MSEAKENGAIIIPPPAYHPHRDTFKKAGLSVVRIARYLGVPYLRAHQVLNGTVRARPEENEKFNILAEAIKTGRPILS